MWEKRSATTAPSCPPSGLTSRPSCREAPRLSIFDLLHRCKSEIQRTTGTRLRSS